MNNNKAQNPTTKQYGNVPGGTILPPHTWLESLAYRAASTTSSPKLLMRKYKYSNSRERSLEKYGLWSPVSSNAVPAGH